MKYVGYIFIGFIVCFIMEILIMFIGGALGSGANEIGYVVIGISLLCAIMVICTLVIVDTITKNSQR